METKEGDYLIPEYEEKIKAIDELKEWIAHPPMNQLLTEHRKLELQLRGLQDKKMQLYQHAKSIIERGYQLLAVPGVGFGHFRGEYSQAGHPLIYYKNDIWPITTSAGSDFHDISPKEFMAKMLASAPD